MKKALSAYLQFLRQPRLLKISKDKHALWQDFLWLLLLDLLLAIIIGSALEALMHYHVIKKYEPFDFFKVFGFWGSIILGCIAAPLLEEAIFRWQLRKRIISLYFVLFAAAIVVSTFTSSDYAKFFLFISFGVLAVAIHLIMNGLKRRQVVVIWSRYYIFLFYFTAVIFGYGHYTNIKGLTINEPAFILFILSQILTGLSLGYIRIKYGLIYAILLHACFNLIVISVFWFSI